MDSLLLYLPAISTLVAIGVSYGINKKSIITNEEKINILEIELKANIKRFDERLETKDQRVKLLEQEKIRFQEALERTYMRSEKAYEVFLQKLEFEKETVRLEKSMENSIRQIEKTSEATHTFLQDLLSKK